MIRVAFIINLGLKCNMLAVRLHPEEVNGRVNEL